MHDHFTAYPIFLLSSRLGPPSSVAARPGRRAHEFLRINYKALDRPLQEDAVASRAAATAAVTEGVAALTVYLVNPRPPGDKLEEYLYSYEGWSGGKDEKKVWLVWNTVCYSIARGTAPLTVYLVSRRPPGDELANCHCFYEGRGSQKVLTCS